MKMEAIKISVNIDVNLSETTQAFIKSLFSVAPAAPAAATTAAAPAAATTAAAPAAKPAAKPAAPAAATTAPTKPAAPAATEAFAVSIEDVRKMLSQKVNDHRAAIKQKLADLGAESVTTLDPSNYANMLDFLKSL